MTEQERKELWEEYEKTKSPQLREKIIVEYAPLVKLVAGRLSMYLGYNVEYDDLVGDGIFGLIDAIDKFDFDKAVKFETYASLRIRGAILDQIRKMDWIPRTVRQKQKKLEQAMREIELVTGKAVTDEQLAEALEISVDEVNEWQSHIKANNLISLNEYIEQGSEIEMKPIKNSYFEQPQKVVEQEELKEILIKSLESLTEKERRVVILYYYEELNLKEISKVLEVSESRVSQLHTKALQKLRKHLGNQIEILMSF